MSRLTEEQDRAVHTFDRPVPLLAAAGSGKTTVLVERYLRILARGATPEQILCITFTKDAAKQLRSRIASRITTDWPIFAPWLEIIEDHPNIGTIHGFCLNLLTRYSSFLGLPPIDTILNSFDTSELFHTEFARWLDDASSEQLVSWFYQRRFGEFETLARTAFDYRNRFLSTAAKSLEDPVIASLADWLHCLQSKAHAEGRFSFDDLESLTHLLLRDHPSVRAELKSQFRAILVDEFQDTSPLQWEILSLLSEENPAKLFVVGDPKQSIYAFRGADLDVFRGAIDQLSRQGAGTSFALDTTYRAHPSLVRVVNSLARQFFQDTAIPFTPMRPGRPEEPTRGSVLSVRRFATTEAEIALAVESVRQALENGTVAHEVAVLFRYSDRILEVAERLRAIGIDSRCNRTESLFESYAVQDLVSYLRALADPSDEIALSGFLRSPYVGLSAAELQTLRKERMPLYSTWSLDPNLRSRGAWFRDFIDSGSLNVMEALTTLFSHVPLRPQTMRGTSALALALLQRAENLYDAVKRLDAWQRDRMLLTSSATSNPGAVHLSTVHGSKGLEFDHVVVLDTNRRTPPSAPAFIFSRSGSICLPSDDPNSEYQQELVRLRAEQRDELRRLLYVALTRAKESLCLVLPAEGVSVADGWAKWLLEAGVSLTEDERTAPA